MKTGIAMIAALLLGVYIGRLQMTSEPCNVVNCTCVGKE